MRFLVTVRFPGEAGNNLVADPEFGSVIEDIVSEQRAEAVYFGPLEGQRAVFYVTDLREGSQIPAILEPWWLRTKAEVTVTPVFNRDEMKRASSDISNAVKRYYSRSR